MSSHKNIRVYRDRFGVPHIFGESLEAAYFGLGYCAGQDRPRTFPLHQLMLKGELAAHLGDRSLPIDDFPLLDCLRETPFFRGYGENSLPLDTLVGVDRWMRNFGYYDQARSDLDELSDRSRAIVEAFADGVNHFFNTRTRLGDYIAYEPATELAWWSWYEHTIAMGFFVSNAFAVAPSRTENGAAWIGGDPHYWFFDGQSEAHLVCPDLDLSGVWDGHVNLGFWGGTNRQIAVHITAAGLEGATVYREQLNPENREEYFDWNVGGYRLLDTVRHEIAVKDDRTVRFVARRTHHGPVVAEALFNGNPVAYTVRSPVDTQAGRRLDQWLGVWLQRSTQEFIDYARQAEFVRSHRVCVDRAGNIGYVCNGPVAVRSDEFDWSKPVDGSTAETEWSDEMWRPGAAVYRLPSFVNPACGFIQSANDPPWVATVPGMTETEFPKYVFPDGWRTLGARGARQRQLLYGTKKLSRRDGEGVVLDVFVPKAYYGVQSLRAGVAEAGLGLTGTAMELDRILESWDGRADVDSVAMTIAFYLDRELRNGLPEPRIAISDDPRANPELRTPQAGSSAEYVRALEAVAELLMEKYGTVQKRWGEIHVIRRPTGDFGVPGGCNSLRALLGTWRGWWDVPDVMDDDGIERSNFGSRTLRFTELRRDAVTVRSLTITGQVPASEHPESPHLLDQSTLYARLEFKQFPLTLAEVTADAREEDHLHCNHAAVEILSGLSARATEAASVK